MGWDVTEPVCIHIDVTEGAGIAEPAENTNAASATAAFPIVRIPDIASPQIWQQPKSYR